MQIKIRNKIIVQKFGGTSVASLKRIERAGDIIISYAKKGYKLAVVVSAMGSTTDELISLAKKINPHPSEREMDMLISTGEQITAALLAITLHKKNQPAISLTGGQVGIFTDPYHSRAKILRIETKRIKEELKKRKIVIITGFQGINEKGEITTLGRGGSDLSAVALAAALGAGICQIYTDVEGVYTADPRLVKDARKISCINFDEMLELAARGAVVMHSRALEVAKKFNIPVYVCSSFSDKEGTLIMDNNSYIEEAIVRGVALTEGEAKITIRNVPDTPGIAAKLFTSLAKNNIGIDMIVQNVSHQRETDISFTVSKENLSKAVSLTKGFSSSVKAKEVLADEDISKVSLVGVGMRSHSGVAAKCFSALAKAKINIEMISTSEISISCIVKKSCGKKALRALHKEFNLGKTK